MLSALAAASISFSLFGRGPTQQQQHFQPSNSPQLPAWLAAAAISGACAFGQPALAAEFSPEQELAAQAWQKTDRNFVDRTFADQDWFTVRQKMVKRNYADSEEVYAEVRKMLGSLNDKYTRFLTPSMYTAIYAVATGDVAGIGVELKATDPDLAAQADPLKGNGGPVLISSVVDGAPSDLAGLKPGDALIEADGFNLEKLTPEEAAGKIRGAVGSKLRLVIQRKGEEEPLIKLITRGSVKLEAVTSKVETVGGAKVGFIRIKQFSTTTADDVKAALEGFGGDAKAFVLDLRGNTGGYFPGGVDVARLFLPAERDITFVVDKRQQVTTYNTFTDGAYTQTPLLLLVDGNTASASEVLSSALQDNGRAKLAGTRTFGKAVIQTVEELDDGSAVVVTIAQYQTPKKTNINKKGIEVELPRPDCPLGAEAVGTCVADDVKALVKG